MTTTPKRELSPAKRALLEQRLRTRATADSEQPGRIPRRPPGGEVPLAYEQERLWFMEQYAPGTAAYVTSTVLRLHGRVDRAALGRALDGLVARHEPLRMTFPSTVDGKPAVRIADHLAVPIDDLPDGPEPLRAAVSTPFDLAAGPLVRALLGAAPDGGQRLVLVAHHIVADGWSSEIMVRELLDRYRGEVAGDPPALEALPVRYGDYACWQRDQLAGAALADHRRYWTDQLAGVPPLELPTDRSRPAGQRFDGATHRFTLDAGLSGRLVAVGRDHGATPFMTLLAGYQVLLARHSGQTDFAVGTPVAGRTRPELENLVGMFVNMIALRAQLSDDPGFGDLLRATSATVLDGLRHQELPFDRVVTDLALERDVARSPVFQAMFALHNFELNDLSGEAPAAAGLVATRDGVDLPATRFDLELQAAFTGSEFRCWFTYNTALFEPGTVAGLAERFETLLRAAVATPATPVSRLPLLAPAERVRLTRPGPAVAIPDGATLHGLVEAQAARTPDAWAVSYEDERLSYVELNRWANRVAHRLRGAGAGPETLVAVCAERSLELVVALLAILKAGAAYVPLDPDYPPHWLAYMLEDSRAPILLTKRALVGVAPPGNAMVLCLDEPQAWSGQPDGDPESGATPDSQVYVIYTSGSTGRPKGVSNHHRGVVNRMDWMVRTYPIGPGDTVLQKTPAAFDVSAWEFFWPLLTGARLLLARPGGHKDPEYLRELIIAEDVSQLHFVPSMLTVFLAEEGVGGCRSLRRVFCSGEELPPDAARRFHALLPGCELFNLYGPTEAAIEVSAWRSHPDALATATTVPIGRPIQNVGLYILDRWLVPVPPGVVGELFIGGVAVARGYRERPALTAERFGPDPFGAPGSRMYRTGDLCRWNGDGDIEFLGRNDSQVKLRGQRIELSEIESRLRELVRDAVVTVREDTVGDRRLVAYVVGADVDPTELRGALKQTLPEYMVPATFVALDALPLTLNGKLNRSALPAPEYGPVTDRAPVAPRNETEATIARVWAEVIGLDAVGVEDDFFDLGGHSMLATRVVARIRAALGDGRSVGVIDLFERRTVAALAELLGAAGSAGPRRLLYELTRPLSGRPVRTYIGLPYGGGSAAVYQPLADALPPDTTLLALAIPGHDLGLDEAALSFEELAGRTTAEVVTTVDGPIVLYGHSGNGGALALEVARRLEAAGRDVEAVYLGGVFPSVQLSGLGGRIVAWQERHASNRNFANWLTSTGLPIQDLEPAHAERVVTNMRADGRGADRHFRGLYASGSRPLRAPVISVVGERDPITVSYEERFREWHVVAPVCAAVVIAEAGHYFLKYRADELAEIVTRTHGELAAEREAELPGRLAGGAWWLHGVSDRRSPEPEGTTRRFTVVAAAQIVALAGASLATWAIPLWSYGRTGSLPRFALLVLAALLPNLLVRPIAGAAVDRYSRRAVAGLATAVVAATTGLAAAATGLAAAATGLIGLGAGDGPFGLLVAVLATVSCAQAFQRPAFFAAIPQLVPKRFLDDVNRLTPLAITAAGVPVPLIAALVLVNTGLPGALLASALAGAVAVVVLAATRYPARVGVRRTRSYGAELRLGLRLVRRDATLRGLALLWAVVTLGAGPALVLLGPLALSYGSLIDAGWVAVAAAAGAGLVPLAYPVWGGPGRRRVAGLLVGLVGLAVAAALTGFGPSRPFALLGAFGTGLGLALADSILLSIVEVRVPQRFLGPVVSLLGLIGRLTLPVGLVALLPLAAVGVGLVGPLVGLVIGVVAVAGIALVRADAEPPGLESDDLVGLRLMRDPAGR